MNLNHHPNGPKSIECYWLSMLQKCYAMPSAQIIELTYIITLFGQFIYRGACFQPGFQYSIWPAQSVSQCYKLVSIISFLDRSVSAVSDSSTSGSGASGLGASDSDISGSGVPGSCACGSGVSLFWCMWFRCILFNSMCIGLNKPWNHESMVFWWECKYSAIQIRHPSILVLLTVSKSPY